MTLLDVEVVSRWWSGAILKSPHRSKCPCWIFFTGLVEEGDLSLFGNIDVYLGVSGIIDRADWYDEATIRV